MRHARRRTLVGRTRRARPRRQRQHREESRRPAARFLDRDDLMRLGAALDCHRAAHHWLVTSERGGLTAIPRRGRKRSGASRTVSPRALRARFASPKTACRGRAPASGSTGSGFLQALGERLGQFDLALHPDKTRLIKFGRHAERGDLAVWRRSTIWASRTTARRPGAGGSGASPLRSG